MLAPGIESKRVGSCKHGMQVLTQESGQSPQLLGNASRIDSSHLANMFADVTSTGREGLEG